MAGESLVFRRVGFSPTLSLLMPTFSFVAAPPDLTVRLQRNYNAPLPLDSKLSKSQLRWYTYARLLSMHDRSTRELLRTL